MRGKDQADRSPASIRPIPGTGPRDDDFSESVASVARLGGGRRIVFDAVRRSLLRQEFGTAVGGQTVRTPLLRDQTCDDELLLWDSGVVAAWRRCAIAEQTRTIPRLGILLSNSPQTDPIAPLIEGLRAAGYIDGETLLIEYRYAEGKRDRLAGLAAELVELNPNVIFAYGGDVAPHAKQATASIPIVVMVSNDPI